MKPQLIKGRKKISKIRAEVNWTRGKKDNKNDTLN